MGRHPGARVSGVVGGALGARLNHGRELAEDPGGDPGAAVVGDDQLVGQLGAELAQVGERAGRSLAVAEEGDDDADAGPPRSAACDSGANRSG